MANDRPDPGEFLERAQRMFRELFGDTARGDEPSWTGSQRDQPRAGHREPSPAEQRDNLTFALATRAVEALEDLSLNVAAIRQRLERLDAPAAAPRPTTEKGGDDDARP
jgi:hypothetical protein